MTSIKTITSIFCVAAFLAGCSSTNQFTQQDKQYSNTMKGAGLGALAGAAVGAVTADKKNRAKHALIGAGIGAVGGGGIGYYMDQQEAKLRQQLAQTGVGIKRNGNTIQLIMPSNITFDSNQWAIKQGFQPVLRDVALVLKEYHQTAISVEGHTDSSGSDNHNQALSNNRAQSVAQVLMSHQVPSNRMRIQGYGESRPIADNYTEQGKSQNRRVEIHIAPLNG